MKLIKGYVSPPLKWPKGYNAHVTVHARQFANEADRIERKRLGLQDPVRVCLLPIDDAALATQLKAAITALKRRRYTSAAYAAVIVMEALGIFKPTKKGKRGR